MRLLGAAVAVWLLMAPPLPGQWLKYPTAGVPRTPDGKPDLMAPAPRTADGKPDLSGMWDMAHKLPCDDINRVCTDNPINLQFTNLAAGVRDGLPYQRWARDRMKNKGVNTDPYLHCIAPGGPRMLTLPFMKKIVQTPALMVILNEYNANYRQIFLDGRPLPEDPQPSWNGYSTGHWEGDTLVVESNGFREDQWLDAAGNPLSSTGRVIERFRRTSFGTMEIEVTINDAKAYTRPWTTKIEQVIVLDTDMLDSICLENEKDIEHLPKN